MPSGEISYDGAMPGGQPLEDVTLKQMVSPERENLRASTTRASPLHQGDHPRLDMTPAVSYVGAVAAYSLFGHNFSNRSSSLTSYRSPMISAVRAFRAGALHYGSFAGHRARYLWSGVHRGIRQRHDQCSKTFKIGVENYSQHL